MDIKQFLKEFIDYLSPKLDTYEQTIYLYIFRHSRLLELDEAVIGFKSIRKRMAMGIGKSNTPMSEGVCQRKVKSLVEKGCLEIHGSERKGTRFHLRLPNEIDGIIPEKKESEVINIEDMDFFEIPENRRLILSREKHKCFYCLCNLNNDNYVMEHLISRPKGNNSYRNIVASCRRCNNKKGDKDARDFLRNLYRDGLLSEEELGDRFRNLELLQKGKLCPNI